MAKPIRETEWFCKSCGANHKKWMGKCPDCGEYGTFEEAPVAISAKGSSSHRSSWTGATSTLTKLASVDYSESDRTPTNIAELDRSLGGGLVKGAVMMISGDPGIGKSTLLLQAVHNLVKQGLKSLYVSGEESLSQIKIRADRLNVADMDLDMLAETNVDLILANMEQAQPKFVVIDSIQTLYSEDFTSTSGSVVQVRECTARLIQFAKRTGCAVFIVGHVTKDGSIAGPRVLEHMVDGVLYFEGESHQDFRILRSVKNRFGAANELGLFTMTESGLESMDAPSMFFLGSHTPQQGTSILLTQEGSRPFLVETQALFEEAFNPNPRRYASGVDLNRLNMLIAVCTKYLNLKVQDFNVYLNVSNGFRPSDSCADLAYALAMFSAYMSLPVKPETACFGEVSLTGELRLAGNVEMKVKEAARIGIKRIVMPPLKKPLAVEGVEFIHLAHISGIETERHRIFNLPSGK